MCIREIYSTPQNLTVTADDNAALAIAAETTDSLYRIAARQITCLIARRSDRYDTHIDYRSAIAKRAGGAPGRTTFTARTTHDIRITRMVTDERGQCCGCQVDTDRKF
jgi:hypothetical protein